MFIAEISPSVNPDERRMSPREPLGMPHAGNTVLAHVRMAAHDVLRLCLVRPQLHPYALSDAHRLVNA